MSRIRADRYTNREGTGAPTFADGVNVVGISSLGITTVTGVGQTALTVNGDARITGVLTVGQGSVTIDGTSGNSSITGVTTAGIGSVYGVDSINDLGFPNAGPLSNRNLIINGAMTVAQRGTSHTSQHNINNYGVDRWQVVCPNTSAVLVHSHETTGGPEGFNNWLKISPSTADTTISPNDYSSVAQKIEGYNFASAQYGLSDAKEVTVSFKFKTNKAGTYCITHRNNVADRNYIHEFTPVADGNWQTITYTVPGDTTGTWEKTNNIGWRFEIFLANGTTNQSSTTDTWFGGSYYHSTPNQVNFLDSTSNELGITGVQVELGSKATPFEHRSFHDEQLKCMRYYQHFGNALASDDGTDDGFMMFHNWAPTTAYGAQKFIVPMRARPSLTSPSSGLTYYSGGSVDSSINLDLIGANTNNGELRINDVSGLAQGTSGWLRIEGSGAYIAFSAEL